MHRTEKKKKNKWARKQKEHALSNEETGELSAILLDQCFPSTAALL